MKTRKKKKGNGKKKMKMRMMATMMKKNLISTISCRDGNKTMMKIEVVILCTLDS